MNEQLPRAKHVLTMNEKGEQTLARPPVDWKGIAAMIGAVLAVLGFFWNKFEAWHIQESTAQVQQVSYEKLAEKLDTLYVKVAALEHVVQLMPSLLSQKAEKIDKAVKSVEKVLEEAKPEPQADGIPDGATVIPEKSKPMKVEKFPASKLPSFQMVQQEAMKLPPPDAS